MTGVFYHLILLAKFNHYGTCGVSNDWFKFYMTNRNKYVPINGNGPRLAVIHCVVPQESALGTPSVFILYNKP